MEQLITNVLTNLVQLAVLGGLSALINYAYHKAGSEKVKKFYGFAKIAVAAAEQTLGAGTGVDKKKYAINLLTSIKVPSDIADAVVEAAVKEMNDVLVQKGLETSSTNAAVTAAVKTGK